jgi:TonB family protein
MRVAIPGAVLALAACAIAFVGCAPSSPAASPPAPKYAEGQLLVLVAPDYPPAALKAGESGSVEVAGKVLPDGSLAGASYRVTPPHADFADAVQRVVPYWRLQPRIDGQDCKFRETPTRVTIWFEIAEGRPKVSYSRVRPSETDMDKQLMAYRMRERVDGRPPRYPNHLLGNLNTPEVVTQVAYLGVAADGTVQSVSLAPMRYFADFEESIAAALKQWRYPTSERMWCAEVPIDFKLR